MTRIFLQTAIAAALAMVVLPSPDVVAQQSDPAAARRTPSAKALIKMAYEKTKTAESDRDFAEIIYFLERALRSDAMTPAHRTYAERLKGWAHNRLGEALVERGRDTAALGQFDVAVQLNPKHWKARHNRGVSYAIDDQLDKALEDFDHVIQLKRDFANGWFNRAEVYLRLGDHESAVRDYSDAIFLAPGDAGLYHARGMALYHSGELDRAMMDLNRAIQVDPELAQAYVDRGDVFVSLGSYQRALADYRAALELNDGLGTAFRSLAWLMATCPLERYRDAQRSLAAANRALSLLGEKDYRALEARAAAEANAKRFDDAVVTQQRAIEEAAKTSIAEELTPLQARLAQYEQLQPYRHDRLVRRDPQRPRPN